MTLADRYKSADLRLLVLVMERPEDYSAEAYSIAKKELESRSPSTEACRAIAREIKTAGIKELFDAFNPGAGKIILPKSHYLTEEEIKEMAEEEFAAWLEKKEAMGFDVWKYSAGGIL